MSDLSRVEQLLRNALGEDIYEVTPQSRVEELLAQLNELIEGISVSVDPEELTPIVTAWLAENIHDGAVVDASLSVAGAAAESKKTGEEISQLKEDLSEIFTTSEVATTVTWEQGRIDSQGNYANANARIRTSMFIGVYNGVLSANGGTDYSFLVHAYDASENYIGTWGGSSFGQSSYWASEFDFATYPLYRFKLTVRQGDGSSNIAPSIGQNIVFTYADSTTYNVQLLHNSPNLGFVWEANGINLDTGEDQTVTNRKRSQYIPVEEGKTYAFNVAESNNAYAEYVFYYTEDKTPILIDTDNSRYYTRLSMGWFPKTLTIPTGKSVAFIRMMVTTSNFDTAFGVAEKGDMVTSYRDPKLRQVENTNMPNNIRGYIGKNVLLLGDSITAQNNWSRWFEASVKPSQVYNYAVGGASWCDPSSSIIYDGSQTPNVIGNQVQKAINNSLANIDCIIILAGTNDTNVTFPTDQDIESAFFDGSMNAVALADVDKTTWQGAMRWSLEKLITTFPNAKIFVCSPVQRVYTSSEPVLSLYSTIKGKCETIEKMSKRMGVEFVDTEQCGISACRSLYFADGLHPNVRAAEKIARYIIARYMAWFCQY